MSFTLFTDLYKKTERICSAIFLVSDAMTNSMELRTKIKHLALDLLSQCIAIKDSMTGDKIKLLSGMESCLLEMTSLFDIASLSGSVSSMNASILKQEFESMIKGLNESRSYLNERSAISSEFFKISESHSVGKFPTVTENPDYIKDSKTNEKDKNNRREHREKAIIDVIKLKGEVNIKDISRSIRGCSEKTIQRKLINLIESGVIKKNGERRWSMYSLV